MAIRLHYGLDDQGQDDLPLARCGGLQATTTFGFLPKTRTQYSRLQDTRSGCGGVALLSGTNWGATAVSAVRFERKSPDVSDPSRYSNVISIRTARRAVAPGPEKAEAMYETVCQRIRDNGIEVATGKFQTHMDVALVNNGPVTLMLESRKGF